MSHSDIFDNFVKIAKQKGLISEADHAEHTEKSFSETNPRMDSLTIEQISKLYNTKPEMPKDMEYKHNIMEDAHPEPVVISPSYDALNGLVENEIEGQNIRLRIVMKEPDGHLTQRKYAEKQLILSLVRVANELDNRNQNELCALADVCLTQATGQPFKKVAQWQIAIPIAAAIGVLYAKQHMRFHSDGFEADYQKASSEIDDLLTSNSNLGVGYSYTPAFLQTVNQLKGQLDKLHTAVQQITPILENIETPRTGQELKQLAQQPAVQNAAKALDSFKEVVHDTYPFINRVITDFGNEGYKQRAIAQKGFLSSLVDSSEILHGGGGLVADDFDDVKHALQTLKVDVDNLVKGLQASESAQASATQQMQATESEESSLFQQPDAGKPEEGGISSLDQEGKGLFGGLLGE